ncbi:hypothetical protein [Enterocloster citroniae]
MTKVRMLMFDENMRNVTKENVELGGDIISKIDEVIDRQNIVKRKILIVMFAVLAISSDLAVVYLIKNGYQVPLRSGLLALLCCVVSFGITRVTDRITLIAKKRKKVQEIENEINDYLQLKGSLKTVKIINSRYVNHMLLATRFDTYSLLIELKNKK